METSYTELQGKHADIMAVKMKLEKNISNLSTALDNEKSSQSTVSNQVEELEGGCILDNVSTDRYHMREDIAKAFCVSSFKQNSFSVLIMLETEYRLSAC